MSIEKLGNWWVPPKQKLVKEMILSEQFQCFPMLEKAFDHVLNFGTAIDIGTWIGDSTLAMSKRFTKVIGFEAHPLVHECCIQNLKDRNITNCQVNLQALSNQLGLMAFYNKGNSTWSGWLSTKETDREHQIINTCKLDDMNLTNIDFVKIDVDSHEGYVLEGAREFLKNNSPVIVCEIKSNAQKNRQPLDGPDAFQILKDAGYILIQRINKADYLFAKEI